MKNSFYVFCLGGCIALTASADGFAKSSKMARQLAAQVAVAKQTPGVQLTTVTGCVSQSGWCKYITMGGKNYSAAVLSDLPFIPSQYSRWVSAPATPLNTPISASVVGFGGPSILCGFFATGDIVVTWHTTGSKTCPSQ